MTVTSRPFQYTTLRFTTKYKMFLSHSYFTVKWEAGTVELIRGIVELRGSTVEFQGSTVELTGGSVDFFLFTVEYTLLYC